MKIEKINENQIRCTLTKEDLADRQIKFSELAYGTEKAKDLFRDMMQQAAYEFGFETEDIPLMIEAIPLSTECILLIVTKVEYPEELDTRFSKFSQTADDFDEIEDDEEPLTLSHEAADGIVDLFRKLHEKQMQAQENGEDVFIPLSDALSELAKQKNEEPKDAPLSLRADLSKLYVFSNLSTVTQLATVLKSFYDGSNTLYKNPKDGHFYLVISKSAHSPEDFNKVCNILSEYSAQEKYTPTNGAFFEEHFTTILENNALQTLATL